MDETYNFSREETQPKILITALVEAATASAQAAIAPAEAATISAKVEIAPTEAANSFYRSCRSSNRLTHVLK